MSYYPNPSTNPNLIECAINYSDIKTLTVVPHDLRLVPNKALLALCDLFFNPNAHSISHVKKVPSFILEHKTCLTSFLHLWHH